MPETAPGGSGESAGHRSGFVAVLGAPNAGKSSLVNALVGRKVAGVSSRPQTTRRRILGIRTGDGCQAVFVDTPGFGPAANRMGEIMRGAATAAARDSDMIMYVVDASRPEDGETMKALLSSPPGPVILALNKTDMTGRESLLPLLDRFGRTDLFAELVPVSARTGDGLGVLFAEIARRLPPGPALFDGADAWAGAGPGRIRDGLVQEVVQEKLFARLHQEIPYGCAVLVEEVVEDGDLLRISAVILAERESHKPILIGAGGSMLKEVGKAARKDLEEALGKHVFLKLWVRIEKDWRNREGLLSDLGLSGGD